MNRLSISILSSIVLVGALACTQGAPAAPASAPKVAEPAKPAAKAATNPAPTVAEDSAEWKAVLEGARKEGQLVVYGSRNPVIDRLVPSFPDRYGFKVDYVSLQSGQTQERTQAEADSGRRIASLTMTGDTAIYQLAQNKLLQALPAVPNAARLHPNEWELVSESGGQYVPYANLVAGLLVNTGMIPEAEAPRNWKDLLDARFKGKIVMPDPRGAGGGNVFVYLAAKANGYGEEYIRQLAQQDLLLVQGAADRDAVVARGERAIAIAADPRGLAAMKGVPLKWVIPEDGLTRVPFVVGVIKEAPQPNAARVFMNWLLSTEFQSEAAKELLDVPTVLGVSGHPLGLTAESMKLLGPGREPPDRFQEAVGIANRLFTR